jgi:putative restriction endonuclease
MPKNNWTREETIIAFNVYCKIPFKNSSKSNPTIIKYANIIGRSPSALNMKVGNFGRLDPELKKQGIVGLAHGSKMEEEVWEEFNGNWEKLAYESELLISKFANKPIEKTAEIEIDDIREGIEREAIVKQRVNQSFFRSAVLSSYYFKCCITGLSIPDLLNASHIIPWSKNEKERLNPRNGLCLNALHDRAFDNGYITITNDYKVQLSKAFKDYEKEIAVQEYFSKYDSVKIQIPDKFVPSKEFLDYHYHHIFKK